MGKAVSKGGGRIESRGRRPRRKVVRLHPGGPWIRDEADQAGPDAGRGWFAMWGSTAVPFFAFSGRVAGREGKVGS
jgi:hypothetical protein